MADNLNCFSDDEETEWLANIDPSVLDKSNEEKKIDDSEKSLFVEENRNSNTTKNTKTDLNVWTRWCNHRAPTQSVCVADCYFIVNVLDLPFASPIAIYR